MLRTHLLNDLSTLIRDFGSGGGMIGPSVYDTAQAALFTGQQEREPILEWIRSRQRADGGWGDKEIPRARDIPTLAAILMLNGSQAHADQAALEGGLAFLQHHSGLWEGPVPNDIPLAAELLIPALLEQANAQELKIDATPYENLAALGRRRLQIITKANLRSGSSPVHSWEAWGTTVDQRLFDQTGSIGHSPAATAAWLRALGDSPDAEQMRVAAQEYLAGASKATGLDIPGIFPTVWPYSRNEQSVSMFALLLAGVLDHPELQPVIRPQIDSMWNGLRSTGQGISDHFATDGDITAMVFAVVMQAGYKPSRSVLEAYLIDGWCLTYANEMQRSFSATVHAAHTFALFGDVPEDMFGRIALARDAEGRWSDDKWHASWLYLTSHTMHALCAAGRFEEALGGLAPLINHQHADGSWGVTAAHAEETAYGIVGLLALDRAGVLSPEGKASLERATRWLIQSYLRGEETGACWAAKELYRPIRISRAIELSALLGALERGYGEANNN